VAKLETLYQILQVVQEADINEQVRQAALDEYSTQVDLIDSQQRSAEQCGEHAAQLARMGDEQASSRDPDRYKPRQRREECRDRSNNNEARKFLHDLRRELTRKRRHRMPTDSSDSDDGSTSGKGEGEGESNKKKQIYQSQLPWYTVETNAQNHKVDKNCKKTKEILRIFQHDITFAERDIH
jgi:hypothetical protein